MSRGGGGGKLVGNPYFFFLKENTQIQTITNLNQLNGLYQMVRPVSMLLLL